MSGIQKLKKKYIEDDQVDGQKILLLNDQYFRALDHEGQYHNVFKINPDDLIEYSEAPIVAKKGSHPLSLITREELEEAITKLIDFAPEALDTLGEIVNQLQRDTSAIYQALESLQSDTTAIYERIGNIENDALGIHEEIRAIQAKVFKKEQKQVLDQDLERGYVDLQHVIEEESIVVFVNRLGLHKDVDFTLSIVNNRTRVTFINDIAAGGVEELARNDYLFFTYYYSSAH